VQDQVTDVQFNTTTFRIQCKQQSFTATYVLGAYGKRANLDKKLERNFSEQNSPWLAVKAHYKADIPSDLVSLHNFNGGYCGISMVEDQKINVCYLTSYSSFKRYRDIKNFQEEIVQQNPHLNSFYNNADLIFEKPLTISQVNFSKKQAVEQHIFMIGDAAGLIHPLCGNGMAMAIQSAKIISDILIQHGDKNPSTNTRRHIENQYHQQWHNMFYKRLLTGRALQRILLNANLQEIAYHFAQGMPGIVPKIIKQTHGTPILC